MAVETITREQLKQLLDPEMRESNFEIISRWLDRGDHCAVYTNVALDSAGAGHRQFTSFGSKAAQIEPQHCDKDGMPPTRMPDIGSRINWKYQLTHVCLGKQ